MIFIIGHKIFLKPLSELKKTNTKIVISVCLTHLGNKRRNYYIFQSFPDNDKMAKQLKTSFSTDSYIQNHQKQKQNKFKLGIRNRRSHRAPHIFVLMLPCSRKFIQNLLNMYRVLLKVDRVSIRIKETVHLHILIKKDQNYFSHSKKQPLINGQAYLSNSSEFLIDSKNPNFDLQIYLIMGTLKKKGGLVQINLIKYAINTSHRLKATIQKSPLLNSTMEIDFVYIQTDKAFENESLISLPQLEEIKHKQYLKQMTQKNEEMKEDKKRLTSEISILMLKNQQLEGEFKELEVIMGLSQTEYRKQIESMEEKRNSTYLFLENQKRKIAEIVDIINQTGDSTLINQVGGIINSQNNK